MNRPSRILYIHHDPGIGGASNSLLALLSGLDRSRFHPVVALPGPGPAAKLLKEIDVAVVYAPMSTFFHMEHFVLQPWHAHIVARFLATSPETARWTAEAVRSLDVSLVHVNSSILMASAAGAKRAGVPVAWHVREIVSRGHFGVRHRLIKQQMDANADAILAVSKAVAQRLPNDLRLQVVYNGIDVAEFRAGADGRRVRAELSIPGETPLVGFISPVYGAKGCYDFVKAAQLIKNLIPDAHFLVAGQTPRKQLLAHFMNGRLTEVLESRTDGWQKMERMTKKYGLGPSFHFLGHRSDTADLYQAIDVLLFPSVGEALGRVLLEASAMECPVVGYHSGGTPEVIEDGKTGLLVHPGDTVALARAAVSLLRDRPLASAFGRAATERASSVFGLDEMVAAVEQVYLELLSTSR